VNSVSHGERVAAFFDLDGTLVPKPSLEWRFFAELRRRQAIPVRNYFSWVVEAVWLTSKGMAMMPHANKMYLRGLSVSALGNEILGNRQPEMAAPHFFRAGVQRVVWHAAQGHAIVLVSGTLAALARGAALMLGAKLAFRGMSGAIEVCATELEESEGRWTGRTFGQAMFGEAKAEEVRRFARARGLVLERSYAYADSLSDRPMLETVGRPVVVNPSQQLQRIARQKDWPILSWREKKDSPPRAQTAQRREPREIWENQR
jgi:alcohol-forming fatty acyl-CoA reductase